MSRLDLYDRFNMNCVNTEDCSKCKCCDDETGDLVLCALMFGYQQGKVDALKPIAKIIDDFVCGRIENSIVALNRINWYIHEQIKGQK